MAGYATQLLNLDDMLRRNPRPLVDRLPMQPESAGKSCAANLCYCEVFCLVCSVHTFLCKASLTYLSSLTSLPLAPFLYKAA